MAQSLHVDASEGFYYSPETLGQLLAAQPRVEICTTGKRWEILNTDQTFSKLYLERTTPAPVRGTDKRCS